MEKCGAIFKDISPQGIDPPGIKVTSPNRNPTGLRRERRQRSYLPVLSVEGNKISKAYGLIFKVPDLLTFS